MYVFVVLFHILSAISPMNGLGYIEVFFVNYQAIDSNIVPININ